VATTCGFDGTGFDPAGFDVCGVPATTTQPWGLLQHPGPPTGAARVRGPAAGYGVLTLLEPLPEDDLALIFLLLVA
jgi:hypothetical protein